MAKKKSKSKGLNVSIKALVLLFVGLAMFGLGFIPAVKVVTESSFLGTLSTKTLNFYTLIGDAFQDGASTEYLIMGICSLAMLIFAGLAVVTSVLWILGIFNKQANLVSVVLYLALAAVFVTFVICFFIYNNNMTTTKIGNTTIKSEGIKISTFVYFLLGVDILGLAGQILVKK